MSDAVEVCVVGAGPAGATLAARLAALGHDVAVVERARFPRAHVGESLSAGAWPLLDALGVREPVGQAGFVETETARVRWRGDDEERVRVPGGLTVDRATFDALLLERARAAGARVLAPVRAARPRRRAEGWEIALGDRVLRTRFVADATGRARLLGGRCARSAPRTLALHALCEPAPAPDGAQTRIDALADGWLWGAHLPGGGFRAMAFVDASALRAAGGERARLLRRLLAQSPLFAELAAHGAVQACDATCYAAPTPIDATSVRVGEAAFAIDPLSSSGVHTAIGTGLAAAVAVHTILDGAGDTEAAIEYYAAHQRHAVERHATTAAVIYAEHRAHAGASFWRLRGCAAPAPEPAPAAPSLVDLLPRRVRLTATAALRDTPCLVDDRIEHRRALVHPALVRPVAFVGGSELAPLLDELQASASLALVLRGWERRLPPDRGRQIVRWLHARQLIEAAP